jgi:hypothetical protein
MLQTSFDHLALQLIGVQLKRFGFCGEFRFPRSIGFDLLVRAGILRCQPCVGRGSRSLIAGGPTKGRGRQLMRPYAAISRSF